MPQLKYWDGTQYVPILGSGISQGDADARYVKQTGDTMTGPLEIQDSAGVNSPSSLTIVGVPDYPEVVMLKQGGIPDERKWKVYVAGPAAETGANGSSLTFKPEQDDGGELATDHYYRLYRDGRMRFPPNGGLILQRESTMRYLLMRDASNGSPGVRFTQDEAGTTLAPLAVLDPGLPEHAATKAYVDAGTTGTLVAYTGWALWGTTDVYCARTGSTVLVGGTFKRTGANLAVSAGSQYQFGSLPAGFRPTLDSMNCWGMCQLSTVTTGSEGHVAIYPDGRLLFVPHTAGTILTNQWIIFNGSFYVG